MNDMHIHFEDIRNLKSRYFRYLDSKDWNGLAKIFCPNAVFDARLATTVGGNGNSNGDSDWYAEGCDRIVSFIRRVVQHTVTVHHGHNHEIELLSESSARGILALEDWIWEASDNGGKLLLHGWGHYYEEYRRDDGSWRIAHSTLTRLNVLTG